MDKDVCRLGSAVARLPVAPAPHAAPEALQKTGTLAQFLEPLGADLRRVETGTPGEKREVFRS